MIIKRFSFIPGDARNSSSNNNNNNYNSSNSINNNNNNNTVSFLSNTKLSSRKVFFSSEHKRKKNTRLIMCILWLGVMTLMGAKTVRRNLDWYCDESLYLSGVHVNPPKGK